MLSIVFFLCCTIVNITFAEFDPTHHENWELLDNRNCAGTAGSNRIIEGSHAKLGEFPWIVELTYLFPDGTIKNSGCSGTILNQRTILTAAHCFTSVYKVAHILIGEWDKNQDPDCNENICAEPVQTIEPIEILYHSQFNFRTLAYDIALIRLARDIEFNSYVWPICMPKGSLMRKNFIGYYAEGAGWGDTNSSTKTDSPILLKTKLQVQDNEYCKNAEHVKFTLLQHQMCVGGQQGSKAVCHGDSGGPLMLVDAENGPPRTYIIGIVSYGKDYCGAHATPSVYTRVTYFMDWILDNLKESTREFKLA